MLIRTRPDALRLCALVFALVAGLAVALGATLSAAQAAPVGKLTQFKVPTPNSQPRHIAVGSDGNLWFTEGNEVFTPGPDPDGGGTFHRNVGRITPTGQITEGNIARITDSGVVTEGKVVRNGEPFGITVAPNGAPWYTMLEANKIARLTPN